MAAALPPDLMPVLFIGHGSPMNAIEDNAFHRGWREVAQRIARPRAVLCISAHWETRGIHLTAAQQPETIHDFYGFPKALFDVRYPAPGDPALAQRAADLMQPHKARLDHGRGLDHGVWSVLRAMYPNADIPIVQLSIDTAQSGAFHYNVAKRLAPLREAGVLILGSGNMVHNLAVFRFHDHAAFEWAARFVTLIKRLIATGEHARLIDYPTLVDARLAIPTPEHYLPLLYALALLGKSDKVAFFNETVTSSISMTSLLIES